MEDFAKKLIEINEQRKCILESLVPLARAAANVLEDLNQKATARPLKEALFQLDSLSQEGCMLFIEHKQDVLKKLTEDRAASAPLA